MNGGRARWLECLAVLLLLGAGLLPRARDLRAPLDREFEGEQAAFFAIGAVNYERLGFARAGGYPVLNVDLGPREDPARSLWDRPAHWYVYPNHPPLVPWLAWMGVKLGADPSWAQAWRDAKPPVGIEPWIRAPFLLAHLAGLVALWWALRQAAGPRRALLGLAIACALPISVLYATLVNYENPVLVCIALAAGFTARWIRHGRRADLAGSALAFAAGGAVTFSALFFLPPLALLAWARRGGAAAARLLFVAGLAGAAPIVAHGIWSAHAQRRLGLDPLPLSARARELLAPIFDGGHPLGEWMRLQIVRLGQWFTWPVLVAALLGLVVSAWATLRQLREARSQDPPAPADAERPLDIEPAFLAGGVLCLLAFYRHTFDPQFTFLMLLVPGIAGLAALGLDRAAEKLFPPRLAPAALAVLAASLALFAIQRANALRFDRRAAPGELHAQRPAPALPLPDATGAELASLVPPGGLGIHPTCMGLNLAVTFYAWRSLWRAQGPEDRSYEQVAQRFGLGAAPRVLLLPKHPWPAIEAQVRAFEEAWVGGAPPDRESEHWRAWTLH